MTVTNNFYQKQIKYHIFNAVTNSELTELVVVFTIRPAFHRSFMSLDNLLLICRLPVIKKEIVLFQLTQSHFFVNPYMFPFHTKLFYQNVKKKKNTDSN